MAAQQDGRSGGRPGDEAARERVRDVWKDYIARGAAPSLSLGQPEDVDASGAGRLLDRLPTSTLGGLAGATLDAEPGAPSAAPGLAGATLDADEKPAPSAAAGLAGKTLDGDAPAASAPGLAGATLDAPEEQGAASPLGGSTLDADASAAPAAPGDASPLGGATLDADASAAAPAGLGGATVDAGGPPAAPGLGGATVDAPGGEAGASMSLMSETDVGAPTGGVIASGGRPNDFVVEKKLAAGGMGEVYVARQVGLDRLVALKRPRAHLSKSPAKLGAFVREGTVTGDLEHPNIVPIYQNGVDAGGQPYYAMKLVKGLEWRFLLHPELVPEDKPDLAAAARERAATMGFNDQLGILLSVCDAVAFAHSRHVLHRDLKPENVLVGDFGEVQVMDWGLAVDERAEATAEAKAASRASIRGPAGTPAYMAPEMALARHEDISVRTDVYLLGAILYELITGRPPHQAPTLEGALMSAATNRFQNPSEANPKAPAGLVTIASRALATDPAARQADVRAFQAEIREYLQHAQSLEISEKAAAQLAGLRSASKVLSAAEASARYVRFAEVVALFRQALDLWKENERASAGLVDGLTAFIEAALDGGDLGLAMAQIEELEGVTGAEDERAKAFRERWHRDDRARRARQRNFRIAVGTAAALLLVIFVGGGFSYYQIMAERDAAAQAREDEKKSKDIAIAKQKEAEEQRAAAEAARKRADEQRRLAEEQKKIAEQKKREADEQRLAAEEAQAKEQLARAEETKQRKLAEAKRRDALRNLASVDIQRARTFAETDHDYLSAARHLLKAVGTVDSDDADGPRVLLEHVLLASPRLAGQEKLPRAARGLLVADADGAARACCLLDDGTIRSGGSALAEFGVSSARHATRWGDAWVVANDAGAVYVDGEPLPLPAGITSVCALASSGSALALGTSDGRLAIVRRGGDAGEGVRSADAHRGSALAVAFVPGSELLLSGGSDGKLVLWDATSLERRRSVQAHAGFIASLAVSRDGSRAATGGGEGTVRVWRLDDLIEIASLTGHTREVGAVAFHPERAAVYSQSWDGSVRAWDTDDPQSPCTALMRVDNTSDSLGLAIAPGTEALVCLAGPTTLQRWDVSDRREVNGGAWRKATIADARILCAGSGRVVVGGEKSVRLLRRGGGQTESPCAGALCAFVVGKALYVLRADGRLVRDGVAGEVAKVGARCVAADAHGKHVAALAADGRVFVADVGGRPASFAAAGSVPGAVGIAIQHSAGAPSVAAWTSGGDLLAGRPGALRKLGAPNGRFAWAGWTGAGDRLVAASGGALFDLDPAGRREARRLDGTGAGNVTCADAGRGVVVASTSDGDLLAWHFHDVGWPDGAAAPIVMASGIAGGARSVTLSDDGATAVCALDDGTLREFRVPAATGSLDVGALTKAVTKHFGAVARIEEGD